MLDSPSRASSSRQRIAVVGSGISGLSAAWLLSRDHSVTLFEKEPRLGGHSHTVEIASPHGPLAVDTGFIVYNEVNYPNLVALFRHLNVPTRASDMSFAASLRGGALEYAGSGMGALFAQKRNLLRPRFWRMIRDVLRFYKTAPSFLAETDADRMTLAEYLRREGYSEAFIEDHLLPMGAAIWSTPMPGMREYPAAAFIRFFDHHGLLRLRERPRWRTVAGGSREYVDRMAATIADIRLNTAIRRIHRAPDHVQIETRMGDFESFDHVVLASHADQALAMLDDPSAEERRLLGAFRYTTNITILHGDETLMPKRRAVWSSWNFLELDKEAPEADQAPAEVCVSYWMNRLQGIDPSVPLFVTLNPPRPPRQGSIHRSFLYHHPHYDPPALSAQKELWRLQGQRRTWFCGSYFGAGFHEDALQAGLAAAEALGGTRRPWTVANENGRIALGAGALTTAGAT